MPAYLKPIRVWGCEKCGANAKVEVYNGLNALVGRYCSRHGHERVAELNKR